MLERFKSKNSSDGTEELIENINRQIKKLNKRVKKLEKENDSYIRLFKTLYLDYELTPKGALKTTFEICQELLNFVDNVCKKHDITYWLDFGNLIGAVRHEGFIPWDDDMDVGMLRKDFDRFYEVVQDEIKEHNLENIITMTRNKIYGENKVIFFIQISIQDENGNIFGGLDVFPYDYLTDDFEGIEDVFEEVKKEYKKNFFNGMEYEENISACYEKLHLSFDKQKYIIGSFDNLRGKREVYNFEVLETDRILPLSTVTFSGREYPCPNDIDYYLTKIYGDYMDIPKVLRFHNRLNELRKAPALKEASVEYNNILKKVNERY